MESSTDFFCARKAFMSDIKLNKLKENSLNTFQSYPPDILDKKEETTDEMNNCLKRRHILLFLSVPLMLIIAKLSIKFITK